MHTLHFTSWFFNKSNLCLNSSALINKIILSAAVREVDTPLNIQHVLQNHGAIKWMLINRSLYFVLMQHSYHFQNLLFYNYSETYDQSISEVKILLRSCNKRINPGSINHTAPSEFCRVEILACKSASSPIKITNIIANNSGWQWEWKTWQKHFTAGMQTIKCGNCL